MGNLVRRFEDNTAIVARTTIEELVAMFDDDLFAGRPGERETFDPARWAYWLEILIDAGEAAAASRVAELSPDFVVHAIHRAAIVFDQEALMHVDDAIEGSLAEELDGYLVIARRQEGWDALLALLLALDRDHRAFLERVLDQCTALCHPLLQDLDELAEALSSEASLAEDIEAAREARRAARGFVEPRAAKAFLSLGPSPERDPLTRAYFRELAPERAGPRALADEIVRDRALPAPVSPVIDALDALDDATRTARMHELGYLANVLVAARGVEPYQASHDVLARLERAIGDRDPIAVLRATPCDVLFRSLSPAP